MYKIIKKLRLAILIFMFFFENLMGLESLIWGAQSLLEPRLAEFSQMKEICGKLDVKRMNTTIDQLFEIGKEYIDEEDLDGAKFVFIALLHVNRFFNTYDIYENYFDDYKDKLLCEGHAVFAEKIQEKADERYEEIASYFESKGGNVHKLLKGEY